MNNPRAKKDQIDEADLVTAQIRLECLKLTNPNTVGADIPQWTERARELEYYCFGIGQAPRAPKYRPGKKAQSGEDKVKAPSLLED